MSLRWYEKHHRKNESPGFVAWFEKTYGKNTDYIDEAGEQSEYWVRRGFALMGWIVGVRSGALLTEAIK